MIKNSETNVKRGQPRKAVLRNIIHSTRFSIAEYEKLKIRAFEENTTIPVLIRSILNKSMNRNKGKFK